MSGCTSLYNVILKLWSLHHAYILASVSPICWFTVGYTTCCLQKKCYHHFNPTTDLHKRQRNQRRHVKNQNPVCKSPSSKDHHLHPSYPLRLWKENLFCTIDTAPTVVQREFNNLFVDWKKRGRCPRYSHSSNHHRNGHHTSSNFKRQHKFYKSKKGMSSPAHHPRSHSQTVKSFCSSKVPIVSNSNAMYSHHVEV